MVAYVLYKLYFEYCNWNCWMEWRDLGVELGCVGSLVREHGRRMALLMSLKLMCTGACLPDRGQLVAFASIEGYKVSIRALEMHSPEREGETFTQGSMEQNIDAMVERSAAACNGGHHSKPPLVNSGLTASL